MVPQGDSSITRLKWVSTKVPELSSAEFYSVGVTIDLDHNYGWNVSRSERSINGDVLVGEVVSFREVAPEIWLPIEMQSTFGASRVVCSRVRVMECELNQSVKPELLVTQFPLGARVDEPYEGKVHLWGDGVSTKTFNDSEEFFKYIYAGAREYQRGGQQELPAAKGRHGAQWVIFVNVVLVVLLGLFTFLRRRMSRGA